MFIIIIYLFIFISIYIFVEDSGGAMPHCWCILF